MEEKKLKEVGGRGQGARDTLTIGVNDGGKEEKERWFLEIPRRAGS